MSEPKRYTRSWSDYPRTREGWIDFYSDIDDFFDPEELVDQMIEDDRLKPFEGVVA